VTTYLYVCLGVALAGSLVFIARLGLISGWSTNPVGRNLMAFMGTVAWLETLPFIHLLMVPRAVLYVVALAGYTVLPLVTWWRTILLVVTQRRTRNRLDREDPPHDFQT
jgi:hypothetical protein